MSGILLATHGGESADGAARVASLLARRLGLRLYVIAVLQPIAMIGDGRPTTATIRVWFVSDRSRHRSASRRTAASTPLRLPAIPHAPSSSTLEGSMRT